MNSFFGSLRNEISALRTENFSWTPARTKFLAQQASFCSFNDFCELLEIVSVLFTVFQKMTFSGKD